MTIEISIGNEIIRTVKGTFDNMQEATDFIFELLKEGHYTTEIWIYHCERGQSVSVQELLGGFL